MLDVRFFANPRFSAASTAVTLVFFALFGATFLQTQYLQFVLGYRPSRPACGSRPIALVLMVTAPLSARLVERVGTKLVVATGLAIVSRGPRRAVLRHGDVGLRAGAGQHAGHGPRAWG